MVQRRRNPKTTTTATTATQTQRREQLLAGWERVQLQTARPATRHWTTQNQKGTTTRWRDEDTMGDEGEVNPVKKKAQETLTFLGPLVSFFFLFWFLFLFTNSFLGTNVNYGKERRGTTRKATQYPAPTPTAASHCLQGGQWVLRGRGPPNDRMTGTKTTTAPRTTAASNCSQGGNRGTKTTWEQ